MKPAVALPVLFKHKEWLDRTAAVGLPRSVPLKALDAALADFEKNQTPEKLDAVKKALEAWKKSKGPGQEWRRSARNLKKRAFEALDAQLRGGGDSEAALNQSPAFMHEALNNSRLGVLYLCGNTTVDTNIFNVILEGGIAATSGVLGYMGAATRDGGLGQAAASAGDMIMKTAMIPAGAVLRGAEGAAYQTRREHSALMARARTWFEDFAKKLLENLKDTFGQIDVTLAAIKNLIDICLRIFAEAVAPFFSAGLNIAKGVANTLDAAVIRVRAWSQGQAVSLLVGHPSVIVSSIQGAMTRSLLEGVYQTLKGIGDAALTATTAGASMIANVVIALAEMLFKMIWRIVEISRMNRFFREAAAHWHRRDDPAGLHRRPLAFSKWFADTATKVPAVAVLALNSGVCGDKMHFLQMFADDSFDTPDADPNDDSFLQKQQEFMRGAMYVDKLKNWGGEYLKNCGYAFSSNDKVVTGLLKIAAEQDRAPTFRPVWAQKVLDPTRRFLNA